MLVGSLADAAFPGLRFYVEFLSGVRDRRLVQKYAEFALERDQVEGVKVFTERPCEGADASSPDDVLEYLHRFPEAVVKYLEHLVWNKNEEKEKYHTLLAVLYLDDVVKLAGQSDGRKLEAARERLQHLLITSSCYRVQLLLGKALENDLHRECAILYGKLEEHDEALRILVHRLKDYDAAEDYCRRSSRGRDAKYRRRLYRGLLAVYLGHGERDDAAAPRLLDGRAADFDAVEVLQMIPQSWSVTTVDRFLRRVLRSSLHRSATSRIASALARGEAHGAQWSRFLLERRALTLTEDRMDNSMLNLEAWRNVDGVPLAGPSRRACNACHESFSHPSFVWCPDGSVRHSRCAGGPTCRR